MSPRPSNTQRSFYEEDDWLNAFLTELEALPQLGPAEASRLLDQARAGSEVASQRLVEGHLEMVVELARELETDVVDLRDLIQEGSLGLLEAVRSYTTAEPGSFQPYARSRILAAMRAAIVADASARAAAQVLVKACTELDAKTAELAETLGQAPTVAELALALNWTRERVREAQETIRQAEEARQRQLSAAAFGLADVDDMVAADGFSVLEEGD